MADTPDLITIRADGDHDVVANVSRALTANTQAGPLALAFGDAADLDALNALADLRGRIARALIRGGAVWIGDKRATLDGPKALDPRDGVLTFDAREVPRPGTAIKFTF